MGTLNRTKTSGPGKKIETLPLLVVYAAFLIEPTWLRLGFELWSAHSDKRSYFLCLPSKDREGVRPIESVYTDAVSMTRALNSSLDEFKVTVGAYSKLERSLFSFPSLSFWAEHSGRATLPSWAACVTSLPSEWIDFLGRWGADKSAGYTRTHLHRVGIIQAQVAASLRHSDDPHELVDEA